MGLWAAFLMCDKSAHQDPSNILGKVWMLACISLATD